MPLKIRSPLDGFSLFPSSAFSLADLSPFAHWNANESEIETATGVSVLHDLTANNRDLVQSNASLQPANGGTLNGKNAISFNGTHYMQGETSYDFGGDVTMIWIGQVTATGSVNKAIWGVNQGDGKRWYDCRAGNSAEFRCRLTIDNSGQVFSPNTPFTATSCFITTISNTDSRRSYIYINGDASNNNPRTYTSDITTTGVTFNLMATAFNSNPVTATFGEMAVIDRVITDDERASVFSHASNYWGVSL